MKDKVNGQVALLNGLIGGVITMAVIGLVLFSFSDIQESGFQDDCIGGQQDGNGSCVTSGVDTFKYNTSVASGQGLANVYGNMTTLGTVLIAAVLIGVVVSAFAFVRG